MEIAPVVGIVIIVLATAVLAIVAAAETALERANDVRIQALAARGEPRARRIAGDVTQPAAFLTALTTARVMAAATVVALSAWLGARAYGPLGGAVGIGLSAGVFVTIVQLTVGSIAARQPERSALQLSGAVRITGYVFALPAAILNLPSRLIRRSLMAVSRDADIDILALVEREEAAGGVEEQERRMIRGIIALEDKTAREVMVPRIDIAAADIEDSVDEVAEVVTERGYSRVPVYRENIDNIEGIVNAKDLLRAVTNGGREKKLADLTRDAAFIPESKRLDELLTEMKANRTHMAIVVDEYGGTAGLVTIEDLLEEIVGEIEDEYDLAAPRTEILSPDEVLVDGGMTTDILKELFSCDIDSEDFDTVGGLLMNRLGRLPSVGDEVEVDGLNLEVLSMSGRRVRRMRIQRKGEHENEDEHRRITVSE